MKVIFVAIILIFWLLFDLMVEVIEGGDYDRWKRR